MTKNATEWAEEIEHFHIEEVQSLGIEEWDMKEVVLRLEEYYA